MKKTISAIAIAFLAGCASTDADLANLSKTLPLSSSISETVKILGEPTKEFYHEDYTALYFCENSKWNELSQRYVWFDKEQIIHDEVRTSRGVVCNKGIPKPSFSGVAYNDFGLFIPTSTKYGQDGLKTCKNALESKRHKDIIFEAPAPLFIARSKGGSATEGYIKESSKKAYQSFATLIKECISVAPKRQNKEIYNLFKPIHSEINSKVYFEINTLYSDRFKASNDVINELMKGGITKKEATNKMLAIEKATKDGHRDILNYIADFNQKIAIARAGRTVVNTKTKVNVRVNNNSGIIPRCRMTASC